MGNCALFKVIKGGKIKYMRDKKIPQFLEVLLPSYNISKLDLKDTDDQELIIEAVLNKGDEKEIKWLFKMYSLSRIKQVLKNPNRGSWSGRALNYWTKIFNIKVHPIIYEMAIFSLIPRPKLTSKYFSLMKRLS